MLLTIEYFAALREAAGCQTEQWETGHQDITAVFKELTTRHGFALTPADLKVAVNDQFVRWDHPLKDNDKLVFIPPVAGG